LGVFPAKSPDVVARVMESHRLDPDTVMPFPGGGEAPLGVVPGIFRCGVGAGWESRSDSASLSKRAWSAGLVMGVFREIALVTRF
jgi:hypothetical protein